jgi:hypothetical protein
MSNAEPDTRVGRAWTPLSVNEVDFAGMAPDPVPDEVTQESTSDDEPKADAFLTVVRPLSFGVT